MADNARERIRKIAKAVQGYHQRSIELIEAQKKFTSEVRNGQRVDTTQETVAEDRKMIAELDAIVGRLGDLS